MSWEEVDEAGWRWVHGLVIPNINCLDATLYKVLP